MRGKVTKGGNLRGAGYGVRVSGFEFRVAGYRIRVQVMGYEL